MSSRFDDFHPDLTRLLAELEASLPPPNPQMRSNDGLDPLWGVRARVRLYAVGALVKSGLYRRLIDSHARLDWFYEFRDYWVQVLGNRSIEPHDYHFLHGVYRQRAGRESTRADGDRDPGRVYALFRHHYRLAQHPVQAYRFARYIRRGAHVLEYACGMAPITTSLLRFYRHRKMQITCVDLPHLLFHFTRWRLRDYPFVRTQVIQPGTAPKVDEPCQVVFCLQVLKYVASPLALIRDLDRLMEPRAYLVFDYVRAGGADTVLDRDRLEALRYVKDHFEIVEGAIPLDGTAVPLTVARRRR
jgi:hypothetical protein